MRHFVLKDKTVVLAESLHEWAMWWESADRRVALTQIGEVRVSTVFLGIDHNFAEEGDPFLFETMVFIGGSSEGRMARYFTWSEAEAGHAQIVAVVQKEHDEAHMLTIDTLANLLVQIRTTPIIGGGFS